MPHAADESDRPGFGPAFHWRNGWTFRRCVAEGDEPGKPRKYGEIGEVLITNADVAGLTGEPVELRIPAAEWASIIEHVSGGEGIISGSTTNYAIAEAFHAGLLARGWLMGTDLSDDPGDAD